VIFAQIAFKIQKNGSFPFKTRKRNKNKCIFALIRRFLKEDYLKIFLYSLL